MRQITVTVVRDGELLDKYEIRAAEWSSCQLLDAINDLFTHPGWIPYEAIVRDAEDDDYCPALTDYYCD